MKKKCEGMGPLLSAYLDGEGSESERRAMEVHIEGCEDCQKLGLELHETGGIIKEALTESPEFEVDLSGVWEEIEEQADFGPTIWQRLKQRVEKPVVWMPTAVATAALVLFLFITPLQKYKTPVELSKVESVYSRTGQVMILQTGKTGQPLIWILPEKKSAG